MDIFFNRHISSRRLFSVGTFSQQAFFLNRHFSAAGTFFAAGTFHTQFILRLS
jgi:hypothetical protein